MTIIELVTQMAGIGWSNGIPETAQVVMSSECCGCYSEEIGVQLYEKDGTKCIELVLLHHSSS